MGGDLLEAAVMEISTKKEIAYYYWFVHLYPYIFLYVCVWFLGLIG